MTSKPNSRDRVHEVLQSYEEPFHLQAWDEIRALGIPAIATLIEALQDSELQQPALKLLCEFGTKARDATSPAIEILSKECDANTVWQAIQLLVSIGRPAIGPLFDRIGRASEFEFPRIRWALKEFSVDEINPGLIKRLKDPDPRVRARCCRILMILGSSKEHDPTASMIQLLTDTDEDVCSAAVAALRATCPTEAILSAFDKGGADLRIACMKVLSESPYFENMEFFSSSLADSDPFVRIHAASGFMRTATKRAEKIVREVCQHEQSSVPAAAIASCELSQGLSIDDFTLRSLCHNEDQAVARAAVALVVRTGKYRESRVWSEWVRIELEKSILDVNDPNRCRYLYSLTQADAFGRSMIPVLVTCLQDTSSEIVMAAIHGLGAIGEGCEDAAKSLMPFLKQPSSDYCDSALYALKRIGPASKIAIPCLLELINDANRQNTVLLVLESMGPAAEPAMMEVAALIGSRTEHAPFVLASIGTREAIIELAKAKASYGRGDRKDFEACCGALSLIASVARPVLEAELKTAMPGDYFWILDGLESILNRAEFYELLMIGLLNGNDEIQSVSVGFLANILRSDEEWLTRFVRTQDAIAALARTLNIGNRRHRMDAIELFSIINEKWPNLVEVFRSQLLTCIRLVAAETKAGFDEIASKPELVRLQMFAEKLRS